MLSFFLFVVWMFYWFVVMFWLFLLLCVGWGVRVLSAVFEIGWKFCWVGWFVL